MRGADAARLIPPGGRGGSVFSLSILSIVPTRAPAPDPDPRPEGVVKDASSSSRGVAGMGMLSVDAVDEGVLSSSFDAMRGVVLVLAAAAPLMRLLLVIVVVPALGLRILRDGVRAREEPLGVGREQRSGDEDRRVVAVARRLDDRRNRRRIAQDQLVEESRCRH